MIVFSVGNYAQSSNDFNKIAKYYIIKSYFDKSDSNLFNVDVEQINKELGYMSYLLKDSTKSKKNISFIDSVYGFHFYSVLHPLTNPERFSYTLLAIKNNKVIEIDNKKVLEFINSYLYKYVDDIGKEKIVELYENLKYFRVNPKFHTYELKNELDSLTFGDLNKFITKDSYTMITKNFDLIEHFGMKNTYQITYMFYWNKLEINTSLTLRYPAHWK